MNTISVTPTPVPEKENPLSKIPLKIKPLTDINSGNASPISQEDRDNKFKSTQKLAEAALSKIAQVSTVKEAKQAQEDRIKATMKMLGTIPIIKNKIEELFHSSLSVDDRIREITPILDKQHIKEEDKKNLYLSIKSWPTAGGNIQRKNTTFKKWKNSRRLNGRRSNTRFRRRSLRSFASSKRRTGRRTSSRMRSRLSTRF